MPDFEYEMPDFDKVTTEEFNHALALVLDKMTGEQFLAIPGIYEVVSEELNNETFDLAWEKFHASD